ncbi:hypothetical protein [Streptomyces sp. NPDC060243]|uniref:hypothetical protein n=1 Tax=Streptomyces sp. NPDC060243 TaxID=3347081 RepID=UPI003661A194
MNPSSRYRKKPVEIEAVCWDGTSEGATRIIDWVLAGGATAAYTCADPERCSRHDGDSPHSISIATLEGTMRAGLGDWIIKGVQGEFYPAGATSSAPPMRRWHVTDRRNVHVPDPYETRILTVLHDGQEVSEEQRDRVAAWLAANGITPKDVPLRRGISVETRMRGATPGRAVIGFWQYYRDEDGRICVDESNPPEALVFQRWVVQETPLAPDPSWPGWADEGGASGLVTVLLREYHRRVTHLGDRDVPQLVGELIGLRGALGIALGGTVKGGDADRRAHDRYVEWRDSREAAEAACACSLCSETKDETP